MKKVVRLESFGVVCQTSWQRIIEIESESVVVKKGSFITIGRVSLKYLSVQYRYFICDSAAHPLYRGVMQQISVERKIPDSRA